MARQHKEKTSFGRYRTITMSHELYAEFESCRENKNEMNKVTLKKLIDLWKSKHEVSSKG